jgi:hypothetical protein
LTLSNCSIMSSYAGGSLSSGGLNPGMIGLPAGSNDGGSIENVMVSGTITSTGPGNAYGGIVGISEGSIAGATANVAINATLTDTDNGLRGQTTPVGGMVGWNTGSIKNATASGNFDVKLTANIFAGAVLGAQIAGQVAIDKRMGLEYE